jgi:hypothetical protein
MMRTRTAGIATSAAIGTMIAVALAGAAGAAKSTKHAFTEKVIAVSITPDGSQSLSKITDNVDGHGVGFTKTKATSSTYPITGVDDGIDYFANGIGHATDTFSLQKPNAHGIGKYTARGHCTGGTGAHKNAKCSFTVSGTVDTNPGGVARLNVVGTYTK